MNWLISANDKLYDHVSAFNKWGYIDWKQNRTKYQVDDIVYIYCTRPYKKVMYKTIVNKINIPFSAATDDEEFWKDKAEYEKSKQGLYVRLKLEQQVNTERLSLVLLQQQGLKNAPQASMKINVQLANYMDRYFNDFYSEGFFTDLPANTDLGIREGLAKSIQVNKYERSSVARAKCIEYWGCKCNVCGIDFEEIYGERGKGFIHIHHIIPLHQINKEYIVNYKSDLIPVCPNCHAMLHREADNYTLSVKELKKILLDHRNRH